jgi:hypothetical protein
MPEEGGFLSRWAQRKAQVQAGEAVAPEALVVPPQAAMPVAAPPEIPSAEAPPVDEAPAAIPAPTMADVVLLTRESDYSRFVAPNVDEGVKRAAMKKLFTDPHYNIMDGLDTYIDDYGKPDPIPLSMLRQMNQSKFLRLFDDDEDDDTQRLEPPSAATTATPTNPRDDDPDLQLQQDDATGHPGPDKGAGA